MADVTHIQNNFCIDAQLLSSVQGLGALVSKNVKIGSRRTSVRLETEMWNALHEVATLESCSIHNICTAVESVRGRGTSFTAALRVFLMLYYKSRAERDIRLETVKRGLKASH